MKKGLGERRVEMQSRSEKEYKLIFLLMLMGGLLL